MDNEAVEIVEQPVAQDTDPDIEIEVVDPVPSEEKPRAAVDYKRYEPEADKGLEEFKKNLDEASQKRFDRLTFQWKEAERRAGETVRERDSALEYARAVHSKYDEMRKLVAQNQKLALQSATVHTTQQIEQSKANLKRATDLANTDEMIAEQEKLARLIADQRQLTSLPEPNERMLPELAPPPKPTTHVDERAVTWARNNPWFNAAPDPTNPQRLAGSNLASRHALGVHEWLVSQNISPDSERYYELLDGEMKQRFPELYQQQERAAEQNGQAAPNGAAKPQQRHFSPVGPVIRTSPGGKRKVTLTPSALNTAKMLGLTAQEYAQQVAKEAAENDR